MTEPLVWQQQHRIRVSIERTGGEVAETVLKMAQARGWPLALRAAADALVPTEDLEVLGSGWRCVATHAREPTPCSECAAIALPPRPVTRGEPPMATGLAGREGHNPRI